MLDFNHKLTKFISLYEYICSDQIVYKLEGSETIFDKLSIIFEIENGYLYDYKLILDTFRMIVIVKDVLICLLIGTNL